jgi:hypothetical protein
VASNAMQLFGVKTVAVYLNVICSNPLEECRKTTKISDKIFSHWPGLEPDVL